MAAAQRFKFNCKAPDPYEQPRVWQLLVQINNYRNSAMQGTDFALDRINEGNWFHIFPEGNLSKKFQKCLLPKCNRPAIIKFFGCEWWDGTKVAFDLHAQLPRVRFLAFPIFICLNVGEIYQRHFSAREQLKCGNQTHIVQVSHACTIKISFQL